MYDGGLQCVSVALAARNTPLRELSSENAGDECQHRIQICHSGRPLLSAGARYKNNTFLKT